MKCLIKEIETTFWKIARLKKEIRDIQRQAYDLLPELQVENFVNHQYPYFKNLEREISINQEKKLNFLRESQANIRVKVNKEWVFNCTDIQLPSKVQNTLALGPKFSIPLEKKDVPLVNIITDVESISLSEEDEDQQLKKKRYMH
ncbi:hypothetical protein HHI36_017347 [Cryptolaemus montrouzieri]|uniref:Uncharacterized protein n=1 Tax=Cryptolaemus montrouzieri TaxID=559131 RepID=A0ABD2NM79_9CUCU